MSEDTNNKTHTAMPRGKNDAVTVLFRGGGDLASAVIHRLWKAGMRVIVCDLERPSCVRRTVSFCNSIYEKEWKIEGVAARYIDGIDAIEETLAADIIPVLTVPDQIVLKALNPDVFVDATISKKKPNYDRSWAPLVIGLGPEITAGVDADLVVETQRGHYLGTLIREGKALPNTGIPGNIVGHTYDRVLRAPCDGDVACLHKIGDQVNKGDPVLTVSGEPVRAPIDGIVRGLIAPGFHAKKGLKVGDIDPRGFENHCYTISDKGRTISGAVLEAIINFFASHGSLRFIKNGGGDA
jgi:xanthine dehydrogenase accessory factor